MKKFYVLATALAIGGQLAAQSNNNVGIGTVTPAQSTVAGSLINTYGGGIFGLRCNQNERHTETISYIFPNLTVGSYNVGMAGYAAPTPTNWNSNEYCYVTVMILD